MPLWTAAVALAGALAATFFLYLQAQQAASTVLDQRLMGAGSAAALLLGPRAAPERLNALMKAQSLDGVFLVDERLRLLADTNGSAGRDADLLRIDPDRVASAFAGNASIARAYEVSGVTIRTGYFPIRQEQTVVAVLGLETGAAFAGAPHQLGQAMVISVLLALLGAAALALLASRQIKAEVARQQALARAGRAELMTQIAAAAAHEIRNPLGVIRGTVELMQERSGPTLLLRDQSALGDVLAEVERLKQLTEDLLDLSADRPLTVDLFDLTDLLRQTVEAARAAFPGAHFELNCPEATRLQGDAARIRQVFVNLLHNSGQATPTGKITLAVSLTPAWVRIRVIDDGPGISSEIAGRLFEPFATSRAGGTGLGLAVSRRFVERHAGTLRSVAAPQGAAFEVSLPRS